MPRERDHPKLGILDSVQASLFSVFSGGLESVLKTTSFADLALWRDIARGPKELLPGWQLGDVVCVDGYEIRGVDTKMG